MEKIKCFCFFFRIEFSFADLLLLFNKVILSHVYKAVD